MSDRRSLLRGGLALGLAATLAACGFTPVYAPGQAGERLRGQVAVQAPTTRAEYALATRLQDRLASAPGAPLQLAYTITTTREDQAISPDQEIQRIALLGQVDYSLTEVGTGRVVASGTVRDETGYNTTGTTAATGTAARDAETRLMVILADRVVEALILSVGAEL